MNQTHDYVQKWPISDMKKLDLFLFTPAGKNNNEKTELGHTRFRLVEDVM